MHDPRRAAGGAHLQQQRFRLQGLLGDEAQHFGEAGAEPLTPTRRLPARLEHLLGEPLGGLLIGTREAGLLGAEAVMEAALGDPCPLGDLAHGRLRIAPLADRQQHRLQHARVGVRVRLDLLPRANFAQRSRCFHLRHHSLCLGTFSNSSTGFVPMGTGAILGLCALCPERRTVSRDAAAADQRRRILAATAALIAEKGYQETTMEEIVRRAKVGYATFYKHYPDKEAAFLALLDAATDRTVSRVEGAYGREEGPWADRVGAALGVLFEDVAAHPAVARAVLVEAVAAGSEAAAKHEAALKRLAPLLRPGRELNPRRAELPESLEETLAGGVVWVLGQRLIAGEAEKLRGLLPETLEFVLRPYIGEDEAAREAGEVADAISA